MIQGAREGRLLVLSAPTAAARSVGLSSKFPSWSVRGALWLTPPVSATVTVGAMQLASVEVILMALAGLPTAPAAMSPMNWLLFANARVEAPLDRLTVMPVAAAEPLLKITGLYCPLSPASR